MYDKSCLTAFELGFMKSFIYRIILEHDVPVQEELAASVVGLAEGLSPILNTLILGKTLLIRSIDKISLVESEPVSKARHYRIPLVPILEGRAFVRTQIPASEVVKMPLIVACVRELTLDGWRVGEAL